MYCVNCGKETNNNEGICDNCKNLNKEIVVNNNANNNNNIKNNNKRWKIIGAIIFALPVLFIVCSAIYLKMDDQKSREEFYQNKAIVKSYAEAVISAVDSYRSNHNGEIPSFDEIKDYIIFPNHEIVCKESVINYDGSVYLEYCNVDKKGYSTEYSYGEKIEKEELTGDKIYIYEIDYGTGKAYSYRNEETDEYKLLGIYNCLNSNCKAFDYSESSNSVLVYDGTYNLYNLSTKKSEKLNLSDGKIYNRINIIETDNKIYGLSIENANNYYSFYNYELGKLVINSSEYSSIYSLDSLLEKKYILCSKTNGDTYIINLDTAEVVKSFEKISYLMEEKTKDKIIYYTYAIDNGMTRNQLLFDENFNLIFKTVYKEYAINNDNTITIVKNNKFEIRDLNNNLLYTSKEYDNILPVKDYVVIENAKTIKVLNLKEEELATLVTLKDNYKVHLMISGWYSAKGKNGIYVVVENTDIPYGTIGSGLEYYYIPSTGETGVIETEGVGGYAKPVLYLYPPKKTNVTISFEKPYLLTTTYPKYKNNWKVTASPNGNLYDSEGKYYYGLYWEEDGSTNVDFSTGFYVTKENAIEFLEEKLDIIGFNAKERNEFIMYWLPILEKNKKSLVYFELTEERDRFNKLIINPKPDSLLRVAIHVKKVNNSVIIKEQKLTTFVRKGFSAVEWGGVIH